MNRSQRLRAMEDLRLHDKASYDKLLQGIRDGKIENESVTLPAGIDRLRNTEWAKSEQSNLSRPARNPFSESTPPIPKHTATIG